MFIDASLKVIRHPNIQNSVFLACTHVHIICFVNYYNEIPAYAGRTMGDRLFPFTIFVFSSVNPF